MLLQDALNLHAVKLSLFLALTLKTQCTVFCYLFGHVTEQIKKLYDKIKISAHHSTVESHELVCQHLLNSLFHLRTLHWRFLRFTMYFNSHFISQILFTTLLLTLPSNIYMVTYISLHPNTFINELFIISMISLQFIALLMFIAPMIILNSSIYAFQRLLVPLQHSIKVVDSKDKVFLRQKVKLALFYEQTLFHCGFTVGPLGEVTTPTMFKVCSNCLSLFLTVFKMFFSLFGHTVDICCI